MAREFSGVISWGADLMTIPIGVWGDEREDKGWTGARARRSQVQSVRILRKPRRAPDPCCSPPLIARLAVSLRPLHIGLFHQQSVGYCPNKL
jgi:hypothetical protein